MTMDEERPNIIFILSDDHASKAISRYGAGINHAPHIDRLANEGMQANQAYVTNSICTPSRVSILCDNKTNKHLPNVAQAMCTGGYQTVMVGKWHLGEGKPHEPTGFDFWSILPGRGDCWDPEFIDSSGHHTEPGYVTDIIADKSMGWIEKRDKSRPFFLMCRHKAPHRSWECDVKHEQPYTDPTRVPETYSGDYKNRAKAARVAKMRVDEDLTYQDLRLVQPHGGKSDV